MKQLKKKNLSSKLSLLITCLFLSNLLLGGSAIFKENPFYTPTSSLTQTGIKKNEEKTGSKEQFKDYLKSKPARFIENKGQILDVNARLVPFVLFKAEAPGMNLYITEKGLTYVFVKHLKKEVQKQEINPATSFHEQLKTEMAWFNVHLDGAKIQRENIIKEVESQEHFNYFYGHCPQGIYEVHQYDKITIREVYPGIDWVFYNSQTGGMKYDFVVHPGADPSQINLLYEGQNPLTLLDDGSISIQTPLGSLKEEKPFTYEQEGDIEIKSSYRLTKISNNKTLLKFNLTSYDSSKRLIIDPQLYWYTFFGGDDWDECFSTDTDENGNIFITGYTRSENFPVQDPGGSAYYWADGGDISFFQPNVDMYVLKFSASANLLWATYYGGIGQDFPYAIETDIDGNVFVTGWTDSGDFPSQSAGADCYYQPTTGGDRDGFITKFQNDGTRLWASYYGGSGLDYGHGLSTDLQGNVWVTGSTDSYNFPTQTAGSFFQATNSGGSDAFILKFNSACVRVLATYYGGSGNDEGHSISIDSSGNAFFTGQTFSDNFSTQTNGGFLQSSYGGAGDVFILKFAENGNRIWATYYGGIGYDTGISMCNDTEGNLFVLGSSESTDFPLQNAGTFFQGTFAGGFSDAYFLKFNNDGVRLWATLMGGSETEEFWTFDNLDIDQCNNVFFSFTRSFDPLSAIEAATPNYSFPYTTNAISAPFFLENPSFSSEPILGRFTNDGDLQWCSYMGGSGSETRTCIAIDQNNAIIFCSITEADAHCPLEASLFPLTDPGAGAFYDNTIQNDGGDQKEMIISKLQMPQLQTNTNSVLPITCTTCDGSIAINVTSGDGMFTYDWSNGVSQSNISDTSSMINNLCPGNYSVIVSNVNYCNLSDTITITLGAQTGGLTIDATPDISTITEGNTVQLIATGAVSYTWNPSSSLTCFDCPNPIAQPSTSTIYIVTATDTDGCTGSDTVVVNVMPFPQPNFESPNVITPNSDGANDVFTISNLPDYTEIIIFNRWGNVVFSSDNYQNNWDGKDNSGRALMDGVYTYKFTTEVGKTGHGFVHLIR
jgi:gliding motility-associated-like protein